MNNRLFRPLLVLTLLLGLTADIGAAPRRGSMIAGMDSRVTARVRYHPSHSLLEKWPYDDNYSFGAGYALYDGLGYLEAGLDYAPSGAKESVVDYVITPRLDMGIKDGIFVAGVGLSNARVARKEGSSEWAGWWYQLKLGIDYPLGNKLELGLAAFYTFKSWGDLSDFSRRDLEYGFHIGFMF